MNLEQFGVRLPKTWLCGSKNEALGVGVSLRLSRHETSG